MPKIIKIKLQAPAKEAIEQTAECLKNGGLVVYPTETAYGLGAAINRPEALQKIWRLKGRDEKKPLSLLVKNLAMAKRLAYFSPLALKIWQGFLPGPLTLVLPKKKAVPLLVSRETTVGLRCPLFPLTQALSQKLGTAFTATSANLSGRPTVYDIGELKKQLGGEFEKIDLVLDAGPLPVRPTSTVIGVEGEKIKLFREGPIGLDKIEKFAKQKGIC